MFRLIYVAIYVAGTLISATPLARRIRRLFCEGKTAEADRIAADTVRGWAKKILKSCGVRGEIIGRENIPDGAAVFTPNHEGDFDVVVMLAEVRIASFISKLEMQKVPLLKDWMNFIHCVYVDRSKKGGGTVDKGAALLREGYSITIFPEGHRNRGGGTGEFRSGAFRMAIEAGVPVVPVRIEGSSRIYEQNKFALKKGTVRLTVLPPVQTSPGDDAKELAARVRTMITGEPCAEPERAAVGSR